MSYNGVKSELYDISYGVPQGSVLGPLLFIIYSNDIPNAIMHSKTVLFADDTTVYLVGHNISELQRKMNQDLHELNDWFRANQLSANASKTKFMLLTRQQTLEHEPLHLMFNNEQLERVSHTKFLGLYIDEYLQWNHHISHCAKKISSGLYAINSAKHTLSNENLKILYYSLIHPYLLYGITLWGNTYKKYLHKLEILQKKAIRTITCSTYNEHTSPLFKTLNILKFNDLHDLHINGIMYTFVNQKLPSPLLDMFEYQADDYSYNTRHIKDPKILLYKGPHNWFYLDADVKATTSKKAFMKKLQRLKFTSY